jgi:hypothetical protein
MISASATTLDPQTKAGAPVKKRRSLQGVEPSVFGDIYQEDVNIVTWQRRLSETIRTSASAFVTSNPTFKTVMTVSSQTALSSIRDALGSTEQLELTENIAELVDMYCCLFDLKRAGLRLTALDKAMCPKFHVDGVPCRLVTTYQGIATQWLPHQAVDRSKLGAGSHGVTDNESGIYQHESDIQQLNCGDVALLKGENWHGNQHAGLVHRSPALADGDYRLLLTLDFSD